MIPLLQRFGRTYPQVRIEFSLDDHIVDLAQDGFDIGIRAGGMPPGSSIARVVFPLSLVSCGASRVNGDLASHNCLRLGWAVRNVPAAARRVMGGFAWRIGDSTASEELPVQGNFAANDFLALESAALAGLGLMQAPLPLVLPHFRVGTLRPVLPSAVLHGQGIHLHYRSPEYQPLRVKLLLDFLLTQLRSHVDLAKDARALCAPYF